MKAIFLAFVLLFSAPAFATHPPPLPTVGEHSAVMLFINMEGEPGHTQADYDTGMANLESLADTLSQLSSGAYTLGTIGIEAITIPKIEDCANRRSMLLAVVEGKNNSGLDLSWADYIIYKITDNREFHGCNFTGLGFRYEFGSWPDGLVKAVFLTKDTERVLFHEFGHNLGWGHSYGDPENAGELKVGVYDSSSFMSYGAFTRCVNAQNLHAIGWHETTPVTESGIYTVPHLYSSPVGTILEIERATLDLGGESYFLSFRKENYGCEGQLTGTFQDKFINGFSLHHSLDDGIHSVLIRPTLSANGGGKTYDGAVFTDGNVTITQLSHTPDDVTVLIDFGDYQEPPPPPPPVDECEVETGKPSFECWCKDHPGNKKCR